MNRSYHELAEHYGTAIVPARVRKPDDKAAAEGTVKFVSTWITAALRDQKLFTEAEAKQAVAEKLEELNAKPFKKRPGSRSSAFEEEEREFLKPLPQQDYEPAIWIYPKVGYDYLIDDGKNKYSVPYDLIGECVDVRLTKAVVEVYYKGTRVTSHVRLNTSQRDPIVKQEHMPEAHRKYLHYNAEEFSRWAASIGESTAEVVKHFLTSGREVEQGYKSCINLKKLGDRYGAARLEDACLRVLNLSASPTIRNISALCKVASKKPDQKKPDASPGNSFGITRGASYYSKGGEQNA